MGLQRFFLDDKIIIQQEITISLKKSKNLNYKRVRYKKTSKIIGAWANKLIEKNLTYLGDND